MKRLLVVGVLIFVAPWFAASQVTFGGGVQTAIAFSSFPKAVKDYYGMGFAFGGHGELNIIKYVSIRLNLDYTMFSSDKDKIKQALARTFTIGGAAADPSQISYEGLNSKDFSITFNGLGKLPTGSIATPYALIGLGINMLSASDHKVGYQGVGDITQALIQLGVIEQPKSETKFGVNFGAGAEFAFSHMVKGYVEFKYALIFTENESTGIMPITVGVTIIP
jgi:opacity protein-like surface antigen